MEPAQEIATTTALLVQQVTRMEAVLQKVANDVSGVAVLASEQRHHEAQIAALFDKADSTIDWQSAHDAHRVTYTEQIKDSITGVASELNGWVNRLQGAAWVLGIVFTISNMIFFGLAVWLFSSVASLRESRQGMETRLLTIEQKYIQP